MSHLNPKILLVEDELDACTTLQSYFARRGFLVSTTGSGIEALSMIKVSKPDLVVLDITLKDISGIETLKRLREFDQETKVIIITGQMYSDEEKNRIMAMGVSGYYNKPLILEEIEKFVYQAIDQKKLFQLTKIISKQLKQESHSNKDVAHQLSNLLGIIRSKCENFVLDINDGIYKEKSDKEIIKMAVDVMDTVMKTVDKATRAVGEIPRFTKKRK